MNNTIFVSGIHGVGKTTFCNWLSKELQLNFYSAGQLINQKINNDSKNKEVSNVEKNQDILIQAINDLVEEDKYILDGHSSLIKKDGQISKVPLQTFKELNLNIIIQLFEDTSTIQERLQQRDNKEYTIALLDELQNTDIQHSKYISRELKIPLILHKASEQFNLKSLLKELER